MTALVAITGGGGFIGKRLVDSCLEKGWQVRILTRDPQKYVHSNKGVTFFQGDLGNPDECYDNFLEGVDYIFHCAAELNDEDKMNAVHVEGTKRLLQATPRSIKRWVQLSSVGVYGVHREGVISEKTGKSPRGVYERTKYHSDKLVEDAAKKNSFEYSVVMPSIVFGDDMPNQSVRQMVSMVRNRLFFFIGNKQSRVNYVSVDDVVRALMIAAVHEAAANKNYILSQTITLVEMVNSIAAGVGVNAPKLRLPEAFVRLLVKSLSWTGFPLTSSRVDALTNQASYCSDKIVSELGFSYRRDLKMRIKEYASQAVIK